VVNCWIFIIGLVYRFIDHQKQNNYKIGCARRPGFAQLSPSAG